MAMGRQDPERQESLFVGTGDLVRAPGHPFYERLGGVLAFHSFDAFVEERCAKFYADKMGRPSIPPPVYFKVLFIGISRAWIRSEASRGEWPIRWPCGSFWGTG